MFFQTEAAEASATTIQLLGAGGFGAIIGWLVYYINRYRRGDVQFSDLTTVIGILGGGAVLALFPAQTDLFGAYGIGLFVGFFSYFFFLMLWVRISPNFSVDWFLDGRSKRPTKSIMGKKEAEEVTGVSQTAMSSTDEENEGFG
jgi:hypothetical protein